jgi:hypothetical protein
MRCVPANGPLPPTRVVESDTLRQPSDCPQTRPTERQRTLNRIGIVTVGTAAKITENEAALNQRLVKLIDRYPEATFVCLEKRSDRFTQEALQLFGVVPEVMALDDFAEHKRVETVARAGEWNGKQYEPGDKVTLYDNRRLFRDSAFRDSCDKVLVLIPRGSSSEWRSWVEKDDAFRERYPSWWPKKVFLSEYGEAPAPKARVRRPKKRKAAALQRVSG